MAPFLYIITFLFHIKKKLFAIALGILTSSTAFASDASAACGSTWGNNNQVCEP